MTDSPNQLSYLLSSQYLAAILSYLSMLDIHSVMATCHRLHAYCPKHATVSLILHEQYADERIYENAASCKSFLSQWVHIREILCYARDLQVLEELDNTKGRNLPLRLMLPLTKPQELESALRYQVRDALIFEWNCFAEIANVPDPCECLDKITALTVDLEAYGRGLQRVAGEKYSSIVSRFPSLTSLRCARDTKLNDTLPVDFFDGGEEEAVYHVKRILQCVPSLTTLTLDYVDADSWRHILRMKTLKHLTIRLSQKMASDKSAKDKNKLWLDKSCSLDLDTFHPATNVDFRQQPQKLRVKRLIIDDNRTAMHYIDMSSLKELECYQFFPYCASGNTMNKILTNKEISIETLRLRYCHNVFYKDGAKKMLGVLSGLNKKGWNVEFVNRSETGRGTYNNLCMAVMREFVRAECLHPEHFTHDGIPIQDLEIGPFYNDDRCFVCGRDDYLQMRQTKVHNFTWSHCGQCKAPNATQPFIRPLIKSLNPKNRESIEVFVKRLLSETHMTKKRKAASDDESNEGSKKRAKRSE